MSNSLFFQSNPRRVFEHKSPVLVSNLWGDYKLCGAHGILRNEKMKQEKRKTLPKHSEARNENYLAHQVVKQTRN